MIRDWLANIGWIYREPIYVLGREYPKPIVIQSFEGVNIVIDGRW